MDDQMDQDLLSDLPDGIIDNILIFLPIRDAIRTSILSSKWRYKWVSLSQLDFGDCITTRVTRTLFRHEGPIHKFKVSTIGRGCNIGPVINEWINFLCAKNIKELVLKIDKYNHEDSLNLSALYSCQNLTLLELYGFELSPPPPTSKGFMCLRTLILKHLKAHPSTIETLVFNSPLLENLECTCIEGGVLRLSAPNLKYFCIGAEYNEIFLCAPLLAKMTATFQVTYNDNRLDCNYTKFFGGVTNLESLTVGGILMEYLSKGIRNCQHQHPLVFQHLKIITIGRLNFGNADEILAVVHLMMDAVNLCELEFECDYLPYEEFPQLDESFWDYKCPQNCSFNELKVLKIANFYSFYGLFNIMKFSKLLLESSPALEMMIVEGSNKKFPRIADKKMKLNTKAELLTYCRASTKSKILFK